MSCLLDNKPARGYPTRGLVNLLTVKLITETLTVYFTLNLNLTLTLTYELFIMFNGVICCKSHLYRLFAANSKSNV